MKRLVFILILLLSSWCNGVTYYLNTASTGTGDGTTTATTGDHAAWAAISEITGLSAGDSVLFNKGDTWTEQLDIGNMNISGTNGSPITFGSYGTGEKPIIDGEDTRYGVVFHDFADDDSGSDWIVLQDIHFTQCVAGVQHSYSQNNIIRRLTVSECEYSGIIIGGKVGDTSNNVTVTENTIYNGQSSGIGVSGYSNDITISSNIVHDNCLSDIVENFTGGIAIGETPASHGTTYSIICEYNTVYDNGSSVDDEGLNIGSGIYYYDLDGSAGNIVRYNLCYGNRMGNIYLEATEGLQCYYNICHSSTADDNSDCGIGIHIGSYGWDNLIYNNVCYGNKTNLKIQGAVRLDLEPDIANTYKWTQSATQNTEYYVELSGGGDPGFMVSSRVGDVMGQLRLDGVPATLGTIGSLDNFEWAWGNNDTLGFDTIYYRHDGVGDPDGSGVGFLALRSAMITGNIIKNNICFDAVTRELWAIWGGENPGDATGGSGNIYEYNCFGTEATNFIEWGDETYKSTYDAWETAYGGSTYSAEADPLFTDAGSDDFHLHSNSPCINAGVDVGLTQDYSGNQVGTIPDIGAYEISLDIPNDRDRYMYGYRKVYRSRYKY